MKRNYLLESITQILSREPKGRVLDLGCGDGDYSVRLSELGHNVTAADLDEARFRYSDKISFQKCDVTKELPFPDATFDTIIFLEIIEHLKNPYFVVKELARILKPGGRLILSTPNVLNLKSRMRYLLEGSYDFFREPPLDQIQNPKEKIFNLHLVPYRYHELEYLLHSGGFKVENIHTSVYEGYAWSFLLPFIKLQLYLKERRSLRKNGLNFSRIHKTMNSPEILFGRHLIVKASKS